MNFLKKMFIDEDGIDNVLEENKELKRERKHGKNRIEELESEIDILTQKYVEILEEKANGFDQYLHYQELYKKYYNQCKEQKKEISNLKLEIRDLKKPKSKRGIKK